MVKTVVLPLGDLLRRFRDSGLGVPIHCTLFNDFPFADDLALIAEDEDTIKKYIAILDQWCSENFFLVNYDKSGLMKVGEINDNGLLKDILLNGKPIKILEKIKYLGFNLPPNGSWVKNRTSG